MSDVTVRPAGDADLAALTSAFGDETFFVDRLARQAAGRGQLLTACLHDRPVGHVYVWWEEAEEREVQDFLPGVPLLNRVKVLPSYQNQGIGTELVLAAEKLLVGLGHKMVALAVRYDNEGARRLYKRLDYRIWDQPRVECRYEVVHPDGTREHGFELCDMLVKDLTESSGE